MGTVTRLRTRPRLVEDTALASPAPYVALSDRWVAVPDTAKAQSVSLEDLARRVRVNLAFATTPKGSEKAKADLARIIDLARQIRAAL